MTTIHPFKVEIVALKRELSKQFPCENDAETPDITMDKDDLEILNEAAGDSESSPSSWKYRVSVSLFVLVYTSWGAWIFQLLELNPELKTLSQHKTSLSSGRVKLLETLMQLRDNYSPNDDDIHNKTMWTAAIEAMEVYESVIDSVFEGRLNLYLNEPELTNSQWGSYTQVFFFVLTLISTIGYGNIAPKTTLGRLFCMIYALIGIPVFLIFIAQSGKFFARLCTALYIRLSRNRLSWDYFTGNKHSRNRKMLGTSLSVSGALTFLICYMAVGAFLFDVTEAWGFVNSFYFCFITMTTIGFGDLIPLQGAKGRTLIIVTRAIYILFGLAITSTAIELVRKHYAEVWLNAERQNLQRNHDLQQFLKREIREFKNKMKRETTSNTSLT